MKTLGIMYASVVFFPSQAVVSSHYILYHFHGFLEAYWLQPVGAVAYFYTH